VRGRFGAIWTASFLALFLFGGSAAALRDGPLISENWAGYVFTNGPFRAVRGEWVEPSASCRPGKPSFVAFWLGLGGYALDAKHLEQIGSEVDCKGRGTARTYSWFELVPNVSEILPVAVRPGDRLAASVSAAGDLFTLVLENRTSHQLARVVRRLRHPDLSSAEWIVEAPSLCEGERCTLEPLATFGRVAFSGAAAQTAAGRWLVLGRDGAGIPVELRREGRAAAPGKVEAAGSFSVSRR